jgi:hypothetical protein
LCPIFQSKRIGRNPFLKSKCKSVEDVLPEVQFFSSGINCSRILAENFLRPKVMFKMFFPIAIFLSGSKDAAA